MKRQPDRKEPFSDLFEETVSSEEIYTGRIVRLVKDFVRLPNGKIATREVVHLVNAVAVVPLDAAGNVTLVRQFRYPFSAALLEIPAGKLDAGESPEAGVRRELSEETGFRAGELIPLGVYCPSVAVMDEQIHLFLARDLTPDQAHLDDDEFLHVETMPLADLVGMIMRGEICDGKTQAAVLKAWLIEQERHSR